MDFSSHFKVLSRLNEAADAAGVKVTFAQKLFFLNVLDLADTDGSTRSLRYTVHELSDMLGIPLRTVIKCLSSLNKIGALTSLEKGKKGSPQVRFIDARYYCDDNDSLDILRASAHEYEI